RHRRPGRRQDRPRPCGDENFVLGERPGRTLHATTGGGAGQGVSSLFDLPFEEPEPEFTPRVPEPPAEQPAPEPIAPVRRILTVSELTGRIRTLLEREF